MGQFLLALALNLVVVVGTSVRLPPCRGRGKSKILKLPKNSKANLTCLMTIYERHLGVT